MKKIFTVLILVFVLVSCSKKKEAETKEIYEVTKKDPERVETLKLKKIPFNSSNSYPGVLKEWDSFTISTEMGGVIEYMPYDVGDVVKKGITILKINTATIEAQYNQLKVAQNIAEINFDRTKQLFDKNLATQSQMDQVQFQKDNAKASIDSLKVNLDKSVVYSPFNGHVLQRFKQKGELAAPGTPILSLIQLNPIKFVVSIPERDIFKISKGNVIPVKIDSLNKEFKGFVSRIGQVANPASHTINVEVQIENPQTDGDYLLKPGMLATATVSIIRETSEIVIPLDSIVRTDKELFIFTNNNGKAKKMNIELISTNYNNAIVKSDLKEGDELVIKGIYSLTDGRELNILKKNDVDISKFNYKRAVLKCSLTKEFKNITEVSQKIINSDLTVIDFFKNEEGFVLLYEGELPAELKTCFSEIWY